MEQSRQAVEQVDLRNFVELAYDEFSKAMLSSGARYLLWGSFASADDLARRWLQAKGHATLSDGRRTERSRSKEENDRLEWAHEHALEASKYVEWARDQGGQPILRDALIGYCTAFESCLKNVALAFRIANDKQRGLDDRVFVPSPQFRNALNSIKADWVVCKTPGVFRARAFFDQHIVHVNPDPKRYDFTDAKASDWSTCEAAFALRNAIVHQMARPSEQVVLGESPFHPGWTIELGPSHLRMIATAMYSLVRPLDPLAMAI